MTKYVYHYFNVRGRGELARLVFAAGGVEYNDNRVPNEAWEENDCNNDIVKGTKGAQNIDFSKQIRKLVLSFIKLHHVEHYRMLNLMVSKSLVQQLLQDF